MRATLLQLIVLAIAGAIAANHLGQLVSEALVGTLGRLAL